jgi:3-oxoacyl-[acyl-carrier-protein] synthase-3
VHPADIPAEYEGRFYMGGRETIFRALRDYFPEFLDTLFEKSGCTRDDIDHAFLHEASGPIFEETVRLSGIPEEKVNRDYRGYGNTISAELAISLDDAVRRRTIKRGDRILLVTYGAGFTCGGVVFDY